MTRPDPEHGRTLSGKQALITGGAQRIGASVARTLHAAGADVAVHYHSSAEPAAALVDELNGLRPDSAEVFQTDLCRTGELRGLVDRVVASAGRLDILINNASTFFATPLADVSEDQWDDLVGTNFKAPLFLASAALPHLRRHHGVIINMIDIHARRPLREHPIYGPAKAALAMLTLSLARDLAPEIRVNGVAPGAILWPEHGGSDDARASIVRQIPLQRTGVPADIADCVLYLVRDATYVTGQIVAVDGGRSVGW